MRSSDLLPLLSPSARRDVESQIGKSPTRAARPIEHDRLVTCTPFGDCDSAEFTVPIRTKNPLNNREHFYKVAARGRKEKQAVGMVLLTKPLPRVPVTVQLTRHGKGNRPMDSDGLAASLKHVRDSIAAVYGLDDADSRIEFLTPKQTTAAKDYAVGIRIERRDR